MNPHVTSTLPDGQQEMVIQSQIFREWLDRADPRFDIQSVYVRAVDFRGKPSADTVMFVHLKVKAANAPFEQIITLRGHTVVMLPVLHCDGTPYTILVNQARIATGEYELAEVPAGMIDGGTFGGAAAKEMEEELGLKFAEHELRDITPSHLQPHQGILFTAGLLDEQARFYVAERTLSADELNELRGKTTGLAAEGEQITLKVIPLADIHNHTRDGKAFIALALYNIAQQSK